MTVITVKTREHGIEGHLLNSKFCSKLLGFGNYCYSGYIKSVTVKKIPDTIVKHYCVWYLFNCNSLYLKTLKPWQNVFVFILLLHWAWVLLIEMDKNQSRNKIKQMQILSKFLKQTLLKKMEWNGREGTSNWGTIPTVRHKC